MELQELLEDSKKFIKYIIAEVRTLAGVFNDFVKNIFRMIKAEYSKVKLLVKKYAPYMIALLRYKLIIGYNILKQVLRKRRVLFYNLLCLDFLTLIIILEHAFMDNGTHLYDQATGIFIGLVGLTGGALAIVFTLNTLIVQHAAQNLPAGFYKIVNGRTQINILYALISIFALIFLYFGITISEANTALYLYVSTVLLTAVFYSLFIIYLQVRRALDPYWMLKEVERYLNKILSKTQGAAEVLATVIVKSPFNTEIDRSHALAYVYSNSAQNFRGLNREMNYLYDFHKKALNNNQKTLALDYLNVITSIIVKYLDIRKDSSFALPTDEIFVTKSDSSEFLTPNIERLLDVGRDYINSDDGEGVRKVYDTFESLMLASTGVKSLGADTFRSNEIFSQFYGYFSILIDYGIEKNNLSAMHRSVQSLSYLGSICIDNSYAAEALSVFGKLVNLSYASAKNDFVIINREIVDAFDNILIRLIAKSKDVIRNRSLSSALDSFEKVIENILIASTRINTNFVTMRVSRHLNNTLRSLYQLSNDEMRAEDILEIANLYQRMLRKLADNTESADHELIETIAEFVEPLNTLLMQIRQANSTDSRLAESIDRELSWGVNLPSWFLKENQKINYELRYDSLFASVVKIAFSAYKYNLPEVQTKATKALFTMLKHAIMSEHVKSYGYIEPHLIARLLVLAVLNIKSQVYAKDTIARIKELESMYVAKWFPEGSTEPRSSPSPDQVLKVAFEIYDKVSDYHDPNFDLTEPLEALLKSLAEPKDVEWMIYRVWDTLLENSSIQNEIENEIRKNGLNDDTKKPSDKKL